MIGTPCAVRTQH